MKLERITLLRPNMGDYRTLDALPPLSMAILAARTHDDVEISFFDDRVEELPPDDNPDLVAITVETFTARRAYEIARQYRERNIPVVMGGYQPTLLPEEVLRHADAVVVGDAEGSWEQLLEDFKNDRLQSIYRGGNERSLDDVVLDRNIFKGKKYAPVEPIQYSRGCRYACDFCSIKTFYKDNVRFRPIDKVVEEIKQLERKKFIFFVDDNLFGCRESLTRLLDAIEPLCIRWSCQISIDVARDDELLDRMVEAGCILAIIGFESLSAENLKQMGKPWNRVAGNYADVVKKFHDRGMAVYGTFVFGYDYDTVETIERSLEFSIQAKLDIANFNPLTPTPGSSLYNRLKQEGRLLFDEWWLDPDYRYGNPIFKPHSILPQEFAEKCFEAKKHFYTWRSIINRVLFSRAKWSAYRTGMIGLANVISRKEVMRKQYRALGV